MSGSLAAGWEGSNPRGPGISPCRPCRRRHPLRPLLVIYWVFRLQLVTDFLADQVREVQSISENNQVCG